MPLNYHCPTTSRLSRVQACVLHVVHVVLGSISVLVLAPVFHVAIGGRHPDELAMLFYALGVPLTATGLYVARTRWNAGRREKFFVLMVAGIIMGIFAFLPGIALAYLLWWVLSLPQRL